MLRHTTFDFNNVLVNVEISINKCCRSIVYSQFVLITIVN